MNQPSERGDHIVQIKFISFGTGDKVQAMKDFCKRVLGSEGKTTLHKIEDLPPLPASPYIQQQYYAGIFRMADSIIQTGEVKMEAEVYDMFRECAEMQGTTLERIIAIILLQKQEGKPIEITPFSQPNTKNDF